ncbi:MAG: histidine--tRNA ligase [Candidatus Omnitrophica bacterium]|nr:histidine--tRNA ligase [Candidatus Omnitrophota bacterium]
MSKIFSAPRGTADILPAEMFLWQDIQDTARQIFANYNYREIQTPVFEETELFTRSMGKTSDVVQKQMLNLQSQKKSDAGDIHVGELSLRPEGTASVVRAYIENGLKQKENISKLFYIGPMFRGERPQKGRLRQFHQIGVEVIGPGANHPYIDAEVIALNVNLLNAFGLKEFELKINTLGSLEDKKNLSKGLRKLLSDKISKLCPDCQNRFERNVFRILDCKNEACCQVVHDLKISDTYLSEESRAYFAQVKEALDGLGIKYLVCHDLVRGLDYYTHTVFEITGFSLGSQDAISAGGRYDNLVSQLGGPEIPAVGFALGIERIILAMGKSREPIIQRPNTYIVSLDEKSFKKGFEILNILRSMDISSDMNFHVSSMKSQMRSADKSGASSVIILGGSELEKQCVSLKDMETGKQEEISIKNNDYSILIDRLRERQ